jgi:uncharacterized DUF497 family protein
MDIVEAMAEFGLNRTSREDCKKYASLLEENKVKDLPDELKGLQVSGNKKCQWFKKKGFINQWKHQISFERISHLFEDPVPAGFEIVYEESDPHSTGEDYTHYTDRRDRLIAKIDPKHYVVVKIDPSYTSSRLVHLVSARYADASAVAEAMQQKSITGSVKLLQDVLDKSDNFDYFGCLPKYHGDVSRFVSVYSKFMGGDISTVEAADLLGSECGVSALQADSIVHDWLFHRNVDVLAKLTGYIS